MPLPYDVVVDALNERAIVRWAVDRGENRPISGYNIYLSEESLKGIFSKWDKKRPKPYNHTPFPGDTDGDINKESFEITHLDNGRKYYVSVRTVGPAGGESNASEELSFVPLSKGRFILTSEHTLNDGGFNFEKGISVPVRDPRNDIYLYAKTLVVGISSPSRLAAGLRKTKFSKEKEKDLETVRILSGDRLSIKSALGRASARTGTSLSTSLLRGSSVSRAISPRISRGPTRPIE